MLLLYLYAELENGLVVGAANKSEYRIGYFVKHGCDEASFNGYDARSYG
jgi:NAD+ synthase